MVKSRITALICDSSSNQICFNPLVVLEATDTISAVKNKALSLYAAQIGGHSTEFKVLSISTPNAGIQAIIVDESLSIGDALGSEAQLKIVLERATFLSTTLFAGHVAAFQPMTPKGSYSPSIDSESFYSAKQFNGDRRDSGGLPAVALDGNGRHRFKRRKYNSQEPTIPQFASSKHNKTDHRASPAKGPDQQSPRPLSHTSQSASHTTKTDPHPGSETVNISSDDENSDSLEATHKEAECLVRNDSTEHSPARRDNGFHRPRSQTPEQIRIGEIYSHHANGLQKSPSPCTLATKTSIARGAIGSSSTMVSSATKDANVLERENSELPATSRDQSSHPELVSRDRQFTNPTIGHDTQRDKQLHTEVDYIDDIIPATDIKSSVAPVSSDDVSSSDEQLIEIDEADSIVNYLSDQDIFEPEHTDDVMIKSTMQNDMPPATKHIEFDYLHEQSTSSAQGDTSDDDASEATRQVLQHGSSNSDEEDSSSMESVHAASDSHSSAAAADDDDDDDESVTSREASPKVVPAASVSPYQRFTTPTSPQQVTEEPRPELDSQDRLMSKQYEVPAPKSTPKRPALRTKFCSLSSQYESHLLNKTGSPRNASYTTQPSQLATTAAAKVEDLETDSGSSSATSSSDADSDSEIPKEKRASTKKKKKANGKKRFSQGAKALLALLG